MPLVRALRRVARSLSARLAAYMAVALIPIGILMVLQMRELQAEAQRRSEAALTGQVLETLRDEVRILMRAQGAVTALSRLPRETLLDSAACRRILASMVKGSQDYVTAAFVKADGRLHCSSTGATLMVERNPNFAKRLNSDNFVMIPNPSSVLSGQPVLTISLAVKDDAGARFGYVGVSVPYSQLIRMERGGEQHNLEDAFIVVYDATGGILSAIAEGDEIRSLLPTDQSLLSLRSDRSTAFTAVAENGTLRTYAAVAVVPGEVFALGSWVTGEGWGTMDFNPLRAVPLVLAMWIGSLAVAVLAGEFLVARHVRSLRRSVADFAGGNRRVTDVDMEGAPRELVELADSYGAMVDTILQDEAELEDMVHQKEVLLREVHHRVKNNLQLIASIMNMQIRQARSDEARDLMKSLHDRVMSLATIHRGLYQTTGLTDVLANELIDDILRQLMRMAAGPGRQFALDLTLEPIRLTPDQAVPLALFLTEAVTNALKYAPSAPFASNRLTVSLRRLDARHVELVVGNAVDPKAAGTEGPAGLGSQLMRAFAIQLGGTLHTGAEKGMYRVSLSFPLRALDEGEARHPGAEAEAVSD